MENQTHNLTNQQVVFLKLIQNEVQFGIVLGLHFYKSMKLKQIARFIDRSDPTTIHHIKQLAKDDLIQLDNSKIVGKYYELSDWGRTVIEEMKIGGDPEDESSVIPERAITQSDYEIQGKVMRTMGILVKNIVQHSATYVEIVLPGKEENLMDKKAGQSMRITVENLKIKTIDQANRLHELSTKYTQELEELKEDCLKTQDGEIDIDYMNFLISVPVSIMHPEKIDIASKKK